MKLLFATRNAAKQKELRRLLAGTDLDFGFLEDLSMWETADEAALELHDSFIANARAKAEHFCRRSGGLAAVADDSGLEVFSLGGEPGTRSRRWAGAVGTTLDVEGANNTYLLRRLAGAPEARRRARYRCVLALVRQRGALPETFEGTCNGLITTEPRGDGGFGYDPYFLSDDLGKTFGEATDEEKDSVSHRGRAVRALLDALATTPL